MFHCFIINADHYRKNEAGYHSRDVFLIYKVISFFKIYLPFYKKYQGI